MIGRTLGHYRIEEKIGAGGMGEVYRATDTKLGREVAIKVLPDAFAKDPERLARFDQEARLLASLNHPNIAAIHGLEESEGTRFLVLELVPGDTLAERIAQEPLPVDEALTLCRQIAEALEAAHERGIIHRDLKPANVKVTPEGKVKVLDFGLAKAFQTDAAAGTDLSQSPTASYRATSEGVILGTAAYMSPEQARGKPVDKRTDIWSFGCVMYEVLTGKQAFEGETASDTISAILRGEPDWRAVPGDVPRKVRDLLNRCFRKDSDRRLRDIGDARIEIEEAVAAPSDAVEAEVSAPSAERSSIRRSLPWGIAAFAILMAGLALWGPWRVPELASRSLTRLTLTLPSDESFASGQQSSNVVFSPDGSRLVYVASRGQTTQLYLRSLDSFVTMPIPGTEGAFGPFFSPDGGWIGFYAAGKLRKVSVESGIVQTLCDTAQLRGASWGPDDTIVFGSWPGEGLMRVSASGGIPQAISTPDPDKQDFNHRQPEFLPQGKAVLFSTLSQQALTHGWEGVSIGVLELETDEQKILIEGGGYARYMSTGHLVYARNGSLFAVPFDAQSLSVTGESIPLVEEVAMLAPLGSAQYTISRDGSLAYISESGFLQGSLVWVDRAGHEEPLPGETHLRAYEHVRVSPDGDRIAIYIIEETGGDVWVGDQDLRTLTRITFGGSGRWPIWSPDGANIAFLNARGGISMKQADGSALEKELFSGKDFTYLIPGSWSPDGKVLAFTHSNPKTGFEIWLLHLENGNEVQPFLQNPVWENRPQFSPDGRWLAYASTESGQVEVYVVPFPGPGGKWQISTGGGDEPIWARNGQEIFYRIGDRLMAVPIDTSSSFVAGKPELLFEKNYLAPLGYSYGVSHDGQRFLMIKGGQQASGAAQINVVLNWFEELKRRLPTGNN